MTTIILEKEMAEKLNNIPYYLSPFSIEDTDLESLQKEILNLPHELFQSVQQVGGLCKTLLQENGYVHIKGLNVIPDARSILLLSMNIGEVFTDLTQQPTIVIPASPTVGANLQGNQIDKLFLHTDFAMLKTPPNATVIQCIEEDPSGFPFGANGIVQIKHIISNYFGSDILDSFYNIPLPFAGKSPLGEDIIFYSPILTMHENNYHTTTVRFHPSRIHYGFRVREKEATKEEAKVLRDFLRVSEASRCEIYLEKGDFLITNNRTTVHDRNSCTLSVKDNKTSSRLVNILFVQELFKQ